jgi:fibronectin type 3 domain-containing protein
LANVYVKEAIMLAIRRLFVFWAIATVLASTLAWANSRMGQGHSVTLTWKKESGVVYNVYRCAATGEHCRLIASRLKSGTFVDKAAKAGDTYRYKVTAVDRTGRESNAAEMAASIARD